MSTNSRRFYDFGPFRVDESDRLLRCGAEVVTLTPKAFEVLLVLVESGGRVLTKEELLKRVWPDTVVEEANLSHNIYKLREALAESDNDQKYIETVHRRGYRFLAEVTSSSHPGFEIRIEERSRAHILIEEDDAPDHAPLIKPVPSGRWLEQSNEKRSSQSLLTKPYLVIALLVILGAVTAGALYFRNVRRPNAAYPNLVLHSIAVLPFKPLVANDRDESLEMGMADTLINRLSSIKDLKVLPFSAVRRYTKLEDEVAQAGSELNVDAVLDGSIQKSGDRVRVSVRLVRVDGGIVIWSEQFDEKLADIFSMQDSIARRVRNQLTPRLNGEERAGPGKPGTGNTDAYLAYLRGLYFFRKWSPADHRRAIQYFNEAVARDPDYALAYAGLSGAYASSAVNNWLPAHEAFSKAREAAREALALDDTQAEVHVTSGAISMFYDLDWNMAEREFQRAIELNPNYPESYEVYSYLLSCTGRLDEGIEMAKRGLQADPISVALSDDLAGAYYWAHRYDEAIGQSKKSLDLDPNHAASHLFIGQSYDVKGNYLEAIASYQKAISLSERTTNLLGLLGHSYAVSGRRDEALKVLAELTEMSRSKPVSPYDLGMIYVGLGEKDKAIEQLKRAYEERAGWIISLEVEPMFDPLRSEPGFIELEDKLKLSGRSGA
jgi:TolB-like protein/DNA-binding winged helix-turn-helix (wHTH) protein/Tfp pilus assembly protein PilF